MLRSVEPAATPVAHLQHQLHDLLLVIIIAISLAFLDDFARMHGVDGQQLRKLNPGFKGGRIVEGVPRLMLMPEDKLPKDREARLAANKAAAE